MKPAMLVRGASAAPASASRTPSARLSGMQRYMPAAGRSGGAGLWNEQGDERGGEDQTAPAPSQRGLRAAWLSPSRCRDQIG
jgi:hypothetical protein